MEGEQHCSHLCEALQLQIASLEKTLLAYDVSSGRVSHKVQIGEEINRLFSLVRSMQTSALKQPKSKTSRRAPSGKTVAVFSRAAVRITQIAGNPILSTFMDRLRQKKRLRLLQSALARWQNPNLSFWRRESPSPSPSPRNSQHLFAKPTPSISTRYWRTTGDSDCSGIDDPQGRADTSSAIITALSQSRSDSLPDDDSLDNDPPRGRSASRSDGGNYGSSRSASPDNTVFDATTGEQIDLEENLWITGEASPKAAHTHHDPLSLPPQPQLQAIAAAVWTNQSTDDDSMMESYELP